MKTNFIDKLILNQLLHKSLNDIIYYYDIILCYRCRELGNRFSVYYYSIILDIDSTAGIFNLKF